MRKNVLIPPTSMSLDLFDANCCLGTSNLAQSSLPLSSVELLAEMDRYGISDALVYHAWAECYSASVGNDKLFNEVSLFPRLHACCVMMPGPPPLTKDRPLAIDDMVLAGARAARLFVRAHRLSLSGWSIDDLLGKLNDRHIPLFLDFGRTHWAEDVTDYDAIYRICHQFRELPIILVREGIGSTRLLYPLLEKFDNLRLEISYYQVPRGLEEICRRFGATHLLFGTGLPSYCAGAPITMLLCADLSIQDKRAIAGGNLRQLLERASRLG